MARLNSRVSALERASSKSSLLVNRIICKGEKPDAGEQLWIREQEAKGMLVIVRTIREPKLV